MRQRSVRVQATDPETVILVEAEDGAPLARVMAVAASLTWSPTPRPLPRCADASPLDEAAPLPRDDPDVEVLRQAPTFTRYRSTWDRLVVNERVAFDRLRSRGRPNPFRALAERAETTEGRLYGLLGLRMLDPALFEATLCRVRDALPETATGLSRCGSETLDVAALIESDAPDAIRAEDHWGWREWEMAEAEGGTPDLRGGALAHAWASLGADELLVHQLAYRLHGDGFIPALDGGRARGRLVHGRRADASDPFLARGGGCVVRTDGRVACWGPLRPGGGRHGIDVVLLPDVLRNPVDIAATERSGCLLDRAGTRVCWNRIEEAAARRAEMCGGPPPPAAALVLRRHDDGPWRSLHAWASRLCGIRRGDGALVCGLLEPEPWVAVPGDVLDVTPGGPPVAWTRDGRVVEVRQRRFGPRELVRLDQVAEVGAFDGRLLARTRDGRVFGLGLPDPWWSAMSRVRWRSATRWRELPELRGARLHVAWTHGCARFDDRRVACFGDHGAFGGRGAWVRPFVRRPPGRVGPTEVPELRTARRLALDRGTTCGWMPGRRLRCLGRHTAWTGAEAAWWIGTAGAQIDLDDWLGAARELPPPRPRGPRDPPPGADARPRPEWMNENPFGP